MSHETVEMIITARDSLRAEVERLKLDALSWRQCAEERAADRERWMRDSNADAAALVENAEALQAKAMEQLNDVTGERDRALAEVERLKLACSATGADLTEIGRLCGIHDDEYPLKAVQRVVAERDSARAEAHKEIADAMLKRGAIEATAGHRVAAGVLTEMAEALLARAEEVER